MDADLEFHTIHVDGILSVTILPGDVCDVRLRAGHEQVQLSVENGVMYLGGHDEGKPPPPAIEVCLPVLRSVVNRGAGAVRIAPRAEARTRLTLSNFGPGTIGAVGSVGVLDAYLAGSGDLLLHELSAAFARLINDGTGTLWAHVRRNARMEANGTGGIRLNPHLATSAQARRLGWDGSLPSL